MTAQQKVIQVEIWAAMPPKSPHHFQKATVIPNEVRKPLKTRIILTKVREPKSKKENKKMSYIDKLLQDVEVEWKTLGDEEFVNIANRGRKPVKASLRIPGEIPYYGANNIQDYVEGYTHEGEFTLIAADGSASLESYSIQYVDGKFWANNHVHVV